MSVRPGLTLATLLLAGCSSAPRSPSVPASLTAAQAETYVACQQAAEGRYDAQSTNRGDSAAAGVGAGATVGAAIVRETFQMGPLLAIVLAPLAVAAGAAVAVADSSAARRRREGEIKLELSECLQRQGRPGEDEAQLRAFDAPVPSP